jgi:DNA polymerase III delta prime subunit
VSLLDTACARVAVSLHATPAEVDDSRKRIEALETELGIIGREKAIGIDIGKREIRGRRAAGGRAHAPGRAGEALGRREGAGRRAAGAARQAAGGIRPVEGTGSKLEAEAAAVAAATGPTGLREAERAALAQLKAVQDKLVALQGETPLILPTVDYQAVASVVGDWTGIPVGRMARNEIETILKAADAAGQRVIGQDHAMEMIAKRIQTSRAGLDNPSKPIGVFMLAGTSGVGKTETALALAEALYGGEQNLITINMSEYQEAHTVSTLKGAPPGYVGYGEGGVLTEAVRRKPYSVVLLDEVEKAHPDVHEMFFQVFDKGFMEDGEGPLIDFKNTLILLTTNAGTELIAGLCKDPELMPDPEGMAKALREPLLKIFPPALLGRLVAIPYYPLSDEMLGKIVKLQLNRIKKRVEARYKIPFEYSDDVVKLVVSAAPRARSGGRMIDADPHQHHAARHQPRVPATRQPDGFENLGHASNKRVTDESISSSKLHQASRAEEREYAEAAAQGLRRRAEQEYLMQNMAKGPMFEASQIATRQGHGIAVRGTGLLAHMGIESGSPTKSQEFKNKTSKEIDLWLCDELTPQDLGAVVHFDPRVGWSSREANQRSRLGALVRSKFKASEGDWKKKWAHIQTERRRQLPASVKLPAEDVVKKAFFSRLAEYQEEDYEYRWGHYAPYTELAGPCIRLKLRPDENMYGDHDLFVFTEGGRYGQIIQDEGRITKTQVALQEANAFQAQHGGIWYWVPGTDFNRNIRRVIMGAHSPPDGEPLVYIQPNGTVTAAFYIPGSGEADKLVSVWDCPQATKWLKSTHSGAFLAG